MQYLHSVCTSFNDITCLFVSTPNPIVSHIGCLRYENCSAAFKQTSLTAASVMEG